MSNTGKTITISKEAYLEIKRLNENNAALVKRWEDLKEALIVGCRSAIDTFEENDDFKYYHKEKFYKKVIEAMQDMEAAQGEGT